MKQRFDKKFNLFEFYSLLLALLESMFAILIAFAWFLKERTYLFFVKYNTYFISPGNL